MTDWPCEDVVAVPQSELRCFSKLACCLVSKDAGSVKTPLRDSVITTHKGLVQVVKHKTIGVR